MKLFDMTQASLNYRYSSNIHMSSSSGLINYVYIIYMQEARNTKTFVVELWLGVWLMTKVLH
jgi:hypothetical protein